MNEEKLEKDSNEDKDETKDSTDEKLKEILDVLNQLENKTSEDGKKKKKGRSFVLDFSPFIFKNQALNVILNVVVNLVIGILVFAYLDVARFDYIIDVVFFMVYFSLIEYFIRTLLVTKFVDIIIASMGTIFFFIGVILLGVVNDVFPEIYFYNFSSIIILSVTLYVGRYLILSPIKKIVRAHQLNKFLGGLKK